jgi:non-specific serine/threonine protein kinase
VGGLAAGEIFISYRRDDAPGHAGRLFDALTDALGAAAVFMDVEAIPVGADFVAHIDDAVAGCRVFLAVIGPRWLTAELSDGRRRLDLADDYVRREIAAALVSDRRVIPVLVQGARMPAPAALPPAVSALGTRNAIELSDGRWRSDVDRLIRAITGAPDSTTAAEGDASRDHLPVELTPMIGRDGAVADLQAAVMAHRLVTVTGVGGSGKTRLAIAAARAISERFPGGAWFVHLSAVREAAAIAPAILAALGVPETGAVDPTRQVLERIRDREVLLVLDNAEQIADVAVLIRAVLEAPLAHLLVTSRERVHVRGEHEFRLGPLDLPGSGAHRTEEIERAPAVELFLDRAEDADPAFALTARNAADIVALCARLDGLPLALELAAAWVRILTPAQIVARLDARLPVLTGRSLDLPERQRTIEAAIASSYDLLNARQRRVFRCLAVFEATFDLAGVAAVLPDNADLDAQDAIGRLVDANLVVPGDLNSNAPRFRLLHVIREFAATELQRSGDEDEARRRHARYYRGLALGVPALYESIDRAATSVLETDYANVLAALRWYDALGAAADFTSFAAHATTFLRARSHLREGTLWADRALAVETARTAERAQLLRNAASLAHHMGGTGDAGALLTESIGIWRELGDPAGLASALRARGGLSLDKGDPALARQAYEEAEWLAAATGDADLVREVAHDLANLAGSQGDWPESERRLRQVELLARREDQPARLASILGDLAVARVHQSEFAAAVAAGREAVALSNSVAEPGLHGWLLAVLAGALAQTEDVQEAERVALESIRIVRPMGNLREVVAPIEVLGLLAARDGDAVRSLELFTSARQLRACLSMPNKDPLKRVEDAETRARARLAAERADEIERAAEAEGVDGVLDRLIG